MTIYSNLSKLIYFGNFPELDTDEGNFGYEGSTAPIIGTVISGPAANANVVSFDYNDADNDGNTDADHSNPGEFLTVDGVASEIDEVVLASVRLTFPGGATSTTSVIGYQLANGDFYIGDFVDRIEGNTVYSLEIIGISDTGDSGPISGFQGGGNYDLDSFTFVACFEADTLIRTDSGERPVQTLSPGDKVFTIDDGIRPIRWIKRSLHKWASAPHRHKPICISAGSLGAGLPHTDLHVSPQHRILMPDPDGHRGMLVPAKKLIGMPGVRQMRGRRTVSYLHLMLDEHHVVLANGTPAESFYAGPQSLQMLPRSQRLLLLNQHQTTVPNGRMRPNARPMIEVGSATPSKRICRWTKDTLQKANVVMMATAG